MNPPASVFATSPDPITPIFMSFSFERCEDYTPLGTPRPGPNHHALLRIRQEVVAGRGVSAEATSLGPAAATPTSATCKESVAALWAGQRDLLRQAGRRALRALRAVAVPPVGS